VNGLGRRARLIAGVFFCAMGAIFVAMSLIWAEGQLQISLIALGAFMVAPGVLNLLSARRPSKVFPEEKPKEEGSTFQQLNRPVPTSKFSLLFAFLPLLIVLGVAGYRGWKSWRMEDDDGRTSQPMEPRAEDVPQLVKQLSNPKERLLAIAALAARGPAAKDAVPALIEILGDKSAYLERGMVVLALGRIGAADPRTVLALCKVLEDESFEMQAMAINALAEMGPQAKDALPALNKLKGDGNPIVADGASKAIAIIEGKGDVRH